MSKSHIQVPEHSEGQNHRATKPPSDAEKMAVPLSALRGTSAFSWPGEEVIQARREAFAQFGVFRGGVPRGFCRSSGCAAASAVPEGVVGDRVEAMLEEVAQVGEVGGHGRMGTLSGR